MNTPRTLANGLRIAAIVVVVAALAAGGLWLYLRPASAANNALTASGTIEARLVRLSPELGGRVVEVLAEEGQSVAAGETLVKLDDATLLAQYAQAHAALQAAQANLSLLQAGPTAEQLQAAEAQLAQTEANLRIAQSNLANLTGDSRPEEVNAAWAALKLARDRYYSTTGSLTSDQLDKVRQAKITADINLSQAKARHDALAADNRNPDYVIAAAAVAITDAQTIADAADQADQAAQDETTLDYQLFEQMRVALETAKSNLAAAQARLDWLIADADTPTDALDATRSAVTDAQTQLDDSQAAYAAVVAGSGGKKLSAAWDEVVRTRAQLAALAASVPSAPSPAGATAGAPSRSGTSSLETALGQVDAASAGHDLAAANLDALKNGARPEQIAAAEAQVAAAQAQLQTIEVQLKKVVLAAPIDGVILSRSIELGETAFPGATLFEIGQLDTLELTVYLPEEKFALVSPGEQATVHVDAYPDRAFTASVLQIADHAEFTPRNVQTVEGRKNTVFAVRLSIANPDLALKPGMPADVTFGQQ